MALYEFMCKKCNRVIVDSFPISSNVKEITCDKCGGKADRMMSVSNFRINGYSYSNGYSKKE